MRRWRNLTSRDLWVAARPAPSEPRGHRPRVHRNWAFLKFATRGETSQATTFFISCSGLALHPHFHLKMVFSLQGSPLAIPIPQARICRSPPCGGVKRFAIWDFNRANSMLGWLEAPVYEMSPQALCAPALHRLLPLTYPVRSQRPTCFCCV